jgi:Arc/MetJ-type ribon-helix-helix transcriptional regulator
MKTQITVRIDDDLVAFADAQVKAGSAESRADLVARALRRERRHIGALRDAAIYAEHGEDQGLIGLAGYAGTVPLED